MIQILFVRSNEIQIKNCQDLLELKVENMNKDSKIKLMNDIDCENSKNFYIDAFRNKTTFYLKGTFDGNEKEIRNIRMETENSSKNVVALFPFVSNFYVKNLKIKNMKIKIKFEGKEKDEKEEIYVGFLFGLSKKVLNVSNCLIENSEMILNTNNTEKIHIGGFGGYTSSGSYYLDIKSFFSHSNLTNCKFYINSKNTKKFYFANLVARPKTGFLTKNIFIENIKNKICVENGEIISIGGISSFSSNKRFSSLDKTSIIKNQFSIHLKTIKNFYFGMISGYLRSPKISSSFLFENKVKITHKNLNNLKSGSVLGFSERGLFLFKLKIIKFSFKISSFDFQSNYFIGGIVGYGSATYRSHDIEMKEIEIISLKYEIPSSRNFLIFGGIIGTFVSYYSQINLSNISFFKDSIFIISLCEKNKPESIGSFVGNNDQSFLFHQISFFGDLFSFSFFQNQTCSHFHNYFGNDIPIIKYYAY